MAALFAAPQLGIQSMFSTMLRMMEEQQKELAKARAETQQLRDEVEIMEPRLDDLDNQVDSIKEQVKTLEFNLSADEDEAPPPAPAPDPMLERMAALEARQQEKEAELQKLREEKEESERLARESKKQAREASQEAQMNLEKEKIKAQAELDRVKLELESKAELARDEAQRAVEEAEKERAAAADKSEAEAAAAEAKLEAAKIAAGAEAAQLRAQADADLAEAKRAAEQAEADAKQQAAEAAAQAEAAKAAEALAEAEAKAAADKAEAEANMAAEKAAAEKAAAEKAAAEAAAAEKPNAEVFKPGGLLRSKMKKNATGIAFIAKVKRQSTITNMASERVLDPKMKLGYRIEQLEEKIVVVEKMKANLERQREDFDKLRECGDESFMNSIRFMIQDEVQKEMGAASLRNDDEKASAMQDQVERQKMMNQQLDELAEKFEKDAVAKISELRVALDVKMNRDEFTNAFKDFDEDGGKDAVGGNDAIAEGDESSLDGEGSASQPMGLRLVQKFSRLGSQIAELETKKADRSSIETATGRLNMLAKDISETGDYMHNVLPELQSADEDLRKLCADAEMRATHAEEQVGGASGATKKLTESMNELKNRELAAEEKLGITGAMAESHDKELQKLARSLEGKPSENAVQGIVEALIEEASIGKGAGGGSSEMIAMMVENLRLDLRNKTSRSDVLRLTAAIVEQMSSQLQPSDTLMAGTVPLRCISCGQHTKGSMHKDVAEKVVHDGLNPNGQPGGQQQVNGSVKQMHKKPHNQLVMATYPNGRAGALRPLQPQGMPQQNLSATGTRHQGAPGNARGR